MAALTPTRIVFTCALTAMRNKAENLCEGYKEFVRFARRALVV